MTNIEQQADERTVLQSIFDHKFRLLDEHQFEMIIDLQLTSPVTIRVDQQTASIQYLPPLSLTVRYHDAYPSDLPPSFRLACFYLSEFALEQLGQQLDRYPFVRDEVCVFQWIELIKKEFPYDQILNDPTASNASTMEPRAKVFQTLVEYDRDCEQELFRHQPQTCGICADTVPGVDCIRLRRCDHFCCRSCWDHYVRINLKNGKFGERILCPQDRCQQPLLPTEIKSILQNDELYERYERLTLQHGLEAMSDVVWCPRCQLPVLAGADGDNLAMCDRCRYTFCKKCKETYHSQTMCAKEYALEQKRLKEQRELERMQSQAEEALADLERLNATKKLVAERKAAARKYQKIVIRISEQDRLLRDILSAERLQSLDVQHCPKCLTTIEKNGGCPSMHCSRCNHDFIWQPVAPGSVAPVVARFLTTDDDASVEVDSLKAELDKLSTPNESDQHNEDQPEITIDNKSALGALVLARACRCPNETCVKVHVKISQDNWMVCDACGRQFCFICLGQVFTTRHFGKKCPRFSSDQ